MYLLKIKIKVYKMFYSSIIYGYKIKKNKYMNTYKLASSSSSIQILPILLF